ncbi:MAG: TIGR00725 family protein [candidate division Zixibacteria bacterium HGW-Zixibacteria-1]|nr:MAG: TIGR00725 family protein [candidate division Zixibacteria bacterium HGW-Zixibacteria-1]
MNKKKKSSEGPAPYIGVIGAGKCSRKMCLDAQELGKAIALRGGILVCGGLGGVMEAASKGAHENGGITIGILPGTSRKDANPYLDYAIPTGLGEGRNLLVVRCADIVIAMPGKFGTLSEMAFCMQLGKPLLSLSAWNISEKIEKFEKPVEAVERAFEILESKK